MVREYKTGFFPSKPSESVHAGQSGTGLLEVSQEIYLSSPQQYRSDQKLLAISIHLIDLNKHKAGAGPVPKVCTATGSLIGVAVLGVRVRMGKRWGSSNQQCGACVTTLHASTCLRRGNEEAEEFDTSSTMFQSLKVPGPHIYSVLQTTSTWYYSLLLLSQAHGTDLCKEAVVSSFTDNCLPSSWIPCSSSIRAADNFLCVRHSL